MLRFFDCNCAIGRWKHPPFGGYETADELEAVLDYTDTDGAIVYHAMALEFHPPAGNARLMDELVGHPRLLPSWILMPHYTGEMPEPEELVSRMLAAGVKLARLFPSMKGHRFSLAPWCAGPLLEELAAHRIPTLFDFQLFRKDDPDWNLLFTLCGRYPTLPIILSGWTGQAARTYFALCQACRNLYTETARFAQFRGMEAFCQRVGAGQLLYGSGLPQRAPGASMATITHAAISAEEKQLIAGGNLERLLREVIS